MLPLRTCTSCSVAYEASPAHFGPHKGCKYGLNAECRICRAARIRDWKRANQDRIAPARREQYRQRYGERNRQMQRQRFETFPVRVQAEMLMSGIRERCKERGWDRPAEFCNKQFFIDWLTRQPNCPSCGVRFHIGPKAGSNAAKNGDSPSIDRFDTSLGYTVTNTALICWRCNNIKRNYSAADLLRVAAWMTEFAANQVGKFGEVAA